MDTECLLRDERGLTSAVGLCALMVLILLALAAAQFMRGGSSVSAEYEREMQLRLAAESGIETAAGALAHSSEAYGKLPRSGGRRELPVGHVPVTGNIEVRVFAEGHDAGQIYLIAVAVDHDLPQIDDGEGWLRGKLVRAAMKRHEREQRYVWQRFF